jgi:hypothetical protein
MPDDLLQRRRRKWVWEFQVDGACAGLDARILGLELRDVVGAVGVQGDIVLLVGQGYFLGKYFTLSMVSKSES